MVLPHQIDMRRFRKLGRKNVPQNFGLLPSRPPAAAAYPFVFPSPPSSGYEVRPAAGLMRSLGLPERRQPRYALQLTASRFVAEGFALPAAPVAASRCADGSVPCFPGPCATFGVTFADVTSCRPSAHPKPLTSHAPLRFACLPVSVFADLLPQASAASIR